MSSLTLKGKASDQAPALANIQAAQKRPVSQPVSQPKPKASLNLQYFFTFGLGSNIWEENLSESILSFFFLVRLLKFLVSSKASTKNDLEENDIESERQRVSIEERKKNLFLLKNARKT
ncbi:uncharacterized protein LOC105766610 isoform X2 [Gossypium raimondii]|uniref:uncharacterized protein LOC105766610 isoform X2 n=1 Tax=Gossypium raimondii TaxID=29730 RepID=UPI00227CE2AA|nr:uncharacterized protein LOC105766610 isoform X2 [Gossypium raimondii]